MEEKYAIYVYISGIMVHIFVKKYTQITYKRKYFLNVQV